MDRQPDIAPSTIRHLLLTSELLLGVDTVPRDWVQGSFGASRVAEAGTGGPRQAPGHPAAITESVHDESGQEVCAPGPKDRRPSVCDGSVRTPFREGRSSKGDLLEALRAEHDATCAHCTTATAHTRTVFGEGDPSAEIMFVGEAPGETEDRLGRPFVGRAGEKLDEIIRAMGLRREAVYIANVLKSRPPENRTPLQHEVEACGPWLRRQIAIVEPRVIVTLGGPATKLLLGVEQGITRLRGIWAAYRDGAIEIPVMPTYHPAYLLRNYTPQTRREVWEDMKKVMERLGSG